MLRASRIPLLQDIEEARLQGLNNLCGSMVAPSFGEAFAEETHAFSTFVNEVNKILVTGSEFPLF